MLIQSTGLSLGYKPKQSDKSKHIGGNMYVNGRRGGPNGVTPNVNGRDMFGMANPVMISGTTGDLPYILNIPAYANDAAAGAAGLVAGDLFRISGALQVKL